MYLAVKKTPIQANHGTRTYTVTTPSNQQQQQQQHHPPQQPHHHQIPHHLQQHPPQQQITQQHQTHHHHQHQANHQTASMTHTSSADISVANATTFIGSQIGTSHDVREVARQLKRLADIKAEKLRFSIECFKFRNPGFNYDVNML